MGGSAVCAASYLRIAQFSEFVSKSLAISKQFQDFLETNDILMKITRLQISERCDEYFMKNTQLFVVENIACVNMFQQGC